MLDLFGDTPVITKPQRNRGASKPSRHMAPITGGMFPLIETLSPDRFGAIYYSGATAYYDALGLIQIGKDVGVVADLLNPHVEHLLRQYVAQSGNVFVDSGAYTRFKEWKKGKAPTPEADFNIVLQTYRRLIAGIAADKVYGFALVMPDVLKEPVRSLELLQEYREQIRELIDAGVNAIVPLQRGPVCAGETAEQVFEILGTRNVTLGIPSSSAKMSMSDTATIRGHTRFHILGRANGMPLYQRAYAILESNPGAYISCDANQFRSSTKEIGEAHHQLIGDNDAEIEDDTELCYDVLNTGNWMSVPQIKAIAAFYGVTDPAVIRSWVKLHKDRNEGLMPVIQAIDPEATLLWAFGLTAVFQQYAEKNLSARLRADAIAAVFSDEQPHEEELLEAA